MSNIVDEIKKIIKSHNHLMGNYVLQVLENQNDIFNLEQDRLQETYNSFKNNFIKSCKEDYFDLKFAFNKQQKSFLENLNNLKDNIIEFTEKCIFKIMIELVVSGKTTNYDYVETLNILNYLLHYVKKYNNFKEIFAEIFDDYNSFYKAKECFECYNLKNEEYNFIFLQPKKEIPDFKSYKNNCIKLTRYMDVLIKYFGYNINKSFVIKICILIIKLNFKRNLSKDKITLLSGTEYFITNLYLKLAGSLNLYKNKKSFLTENEVNKYLKKTIYHIIDNMFDGEWFKKYCLIYNYFKDKNIKPLKKEIETELRKTYCKEEDKDILDSKLKCLSIIDFNSETKKYLKIINKITDKLNILIFNDSLTEKDIIKLEFELAKIIKKNDFLLLNIIRGYKDTLVAKYNLNRKLILGKLLFYMYNIIEICISKQKYFKNNLRNKNTATNSYSLILFTVINYSKCLNKKNKYYYILQNKLIDHFDGKQTELIDDDKISKSSFLQSIFKLEFDPDCINYFCFYTIIEKLLKVNDTYYFYRTKFKKEDINYYIFFMTVLFKCNQKEVIKDVLSDMMDNIKKTEEHVSEELLNYNKNTKIENIEELEEMIISKETYKFLYKLKIKTVFDRIFVSEILKFVKNKKGYNPENVIKRLKNNINLEDIYCSTYYDTEHYLDAIKSSIEYRKDNIIHKYFFDCSTKLHLCYIKDHIENPETNYYVNYSDFIYKVVIFYICKDHFNNVRSKYV